MDVSAREVKVVLLGDAGVGKSCLVLRFVTGSFDKYSESTIGASFMSKLITVDSQPIKYQIWDTAGACDGTPFGCTLAAGRDARGLFSLVPLEGCWDWQQ